jgi:Mrp family chromosome partitioning ATPase/capsular polysaccharide biosynthesis protein
MSWVGPAAQAQGLPRYIEVLRSGRWLVILSFLLCVGAAGLYLSQAEKVYEAEADLLVQPVPRDNLVRIPGLIVESSDPTRDVETAARLVEAPSVTRRVKERLSLPGSLKSIAGKVSVKPIAQSNIVNITAKGPTPKAAQRLANAYGEEMVNDRTERMKEALIPIRKVLAPRAAAEGPEALASESSATSQIAYIDTLEKDPTVRLESPAELPDSPVSPRPVLTLGAAIMGGLVIGLLGAFGLSLLDPRLRREEQLRSRFRLPVLARVPVERGRRGKPLLPTELSMGALDSYQALRAALTTSRKDALIGRAILVTGPSPGDGKTTSAINLASTLAAAGKRVILIEADSRRPSIGKALGLVPERGLASVITGRTYLVDALVPVGGDDSKLRVLLTSPDEAPAADVLSHIAVETLLLQAQKLADWVVVDSPPLNHVAETMTIAKMVDDVLIVVRLGRSNMRDLDELAEMLVQQEIEPSGFVVLSGQARPGYY